jgi:predicted DNA-binding protein (MmcQ/YjbR family)
MSQSGPKTERMRKIALALPETHEELTWGEDVNFRVGKKIFCFPGDQAMTVKADPDERESLLADGRFTIAPYVGRFGWLRMDVSGKVDWSEVAELITTSYCLIAPKKLAKQVLESRRA